MQYRECAPPVELAGQVEAIWALSGRASARDAPRRVLPDGCTELILNFGDPIVQETGGPFAQPALMFVGQITGPLQIRPTGRVDLLGVRFRPGGAAGLMPVPQCELVDRSMPLAEVAKDVAGRLAPALDQEEPDRRFGLVVAALGKSLAPGRTAVSDTADAIVRAWGMIPVGRLAAGTGLGMRQLERRFLDEVGMSPKRLARISRFQRVFHAMERDDADWTRVAVECGYYDSSHLVRDFHEFAGDAPSRAVAELEDLTLAFTRANRVTG
jgi:AraC-like DNA-binding protein